MKENLAKNLFADVQSLRDGSNIRCVFITHDTFLRSPYSAWTKSPVYTPLPLGSLVVMMQHHSQKGRSIAEQVVLRYVVNLPSFALRETQYVRYMHTQAAYKPRQCRKVWASTNPHLPRPTSLGSFHLNRLLAQSTTVEQDVKEDTDISGPRPLDGSTCPTTSTFATMAKTSSETEIFPLHCANHQGRPEIWHCGLSLTSSRSHKSLLRTRIGQ